MPPLCADDDGDIPVNTSTGLAPTLRSRSMAGATPIVFIVDDDISVRESLESLVADAGWQLRAFRPIP